MKQYVFTQTHNSSRGGLMVSFPLWNKDMFINHVNKLDKKEYGSIFRYGSVGGYMNNLKDMSLEEFYQIFPENPFCEEHITLFFRKEISLKYGEHKAKSQIKPVSKRDLKIGFRYKDFSGNEWIYFGYVEKTIDKTAYMSQWSKKDPEVLTGHAFLFAYDLRYTNEIADRIDILKSIKKLMYQTGEEEEFYLPESKELKYESGVSNHSSYRGNERIVTVKFL